MNGLSDDDAARNQHWQLAIAVSASAQSHNNDATRIQCWQGFNAVDPMQLIQHGQLQSVPVLNSTVMTLIVFNTGNTNSAVL
ncbi:hypothetical protein CKO09_12720 [Chromatium weissei]|nr:hypothetical protein [Chromatium weissei]